MLGLVVSLWKLNLNTKEREVYRADIFDKIEDVYSFVSCLKIQVNFGGGYRTSFFYDKNSIFENLSLHIANSIKNALEIVEIEEEEYLENSKYKSVEFEMPSYFDASIFISLLHERVEFLKNNFEFKNILFSENDFDFIYFRGREKLYKVSISDVDDFQKKFLKYIDDLKQEENLIYYQSISDRFLIPASSPDNMIDYVYIPRTRLPNIEMYGILNSQSVDLENPNINKIAINSFDARMSFVREVRDFDDSLILMYGYGDRILKISKNMDISYSESVGSFVGYENNLIEDLKLAVLNIQKLGYSKEDLKIYSVERISDNNQNGHEFKFFYRINHFPVLNPNFKPYIQAKIINSGVANINLKLIKTTGEVAELMYISDMLTSEEPFFSILDDRENFDRFYDDYIESLQKKGVEQEVLNSFAEEVENHSPNNENLPKYQIVLGAIKNFYISYIFINDRIEPCFVINIDDRYYVVDYYNYKILN